MYTCLADSGLRFPPYLANYNRKRSAFVHYFAGDEGIDPLFLIRFAHKNAGRGSPTSTRSARLVYRLCRSIPSSSSHDTQQGEPMLSLLIIAGDEGIEPPTEVLETSVMPLN